MLGGMGTGLITFFGVVCLVAAVALLWIAMPDKAGISPHFVRNQAAEMLYPVFVMAIFIVGVVVLSKGGAG